MRDRTSDQVTAAFQNTEPAALRIHRRSAFLTFSEEVDATTDALMPLHHFSPCGFGPPFGGRRIVGGSCWTTSISRARAAPCRGVRADTAVRQRSKRSVPAGSPCGSPTCLAAPPRPRRGRLGGPTPEVGGLHHGVTGAGTGRARCGRRTAKQQSGALRR